MTMINDERLTPTRALAKLREYLGGGEEARAEARILLTACTGLRIEQLLMMDDAPLAPDAADRLFIMAQRRKEGEPIAYITGQTYFYGLPILTEAGVLIPRHDTECVAQAAISALSDGSAALDLCCGTGCIAAAVKSERPSARVCASDIDGAAEKLAKRNAECLGLSIEVRKGDLFSPWEGERFDVIVSNPPYIGECDHVDTDVAEYEPHTALFAAEGGLKIIADIIIKAPGYLNEGGTLVLEHGDGQRERVKELAEKSGFAVKEYLVDGGGLYRGVCLKVR